jgi:hypothetical protein
MFSSIFWTYNSSFKLSLNSHIEHIGVIETDTVFPMTKQKSDEILNINLKDQAIIADSLKGPFKSTGRVYISIDQLYTHQRPRKLYLYEIECMLQYLGYKLINREDAVDGDLEFNISIEGSPTGLIYNYIGFQYVIASMRVTISFLGHSTTYWGASEPPEVINGTRSAESVESSKYEEAFKNAVTRDMLKRVFKPIDLNTFDRIKGILNDEKNIYYDEAWYNIEDRIYSVSNSEPADSLLDLINECYLGPEFHNKLVRVHVSDLNIYEAYIIPLLLSIEDKRVINPLMNFLWYGDYNPITQRDYKRFLEKQRFLAMLDLEDIYNHFDKIDPNVFSVLFNVFPNVG